MNIALGIEHNPLPADFLDLGNEINASYRAAQHHLRSHPDKLKLFVGKADLWTHMAHVTHAEFIAILESGDAERTMKYLNNLPINGIGLGIQRYDYGCAVESNPDLMNRLAKVFLERLIGLAEYLGVLAIDYPETGQKDKWAARYSVGDVVQMLERRLGFPLMFPKVFSNQFGLAVGAGVIEERGLQAIYTASRICSLLDFAGVRRSEARILEIGGGMGTLAYFCNKMGIGKYHVIDLPYINAVQQYLLRSLLGKEKVRTFRDARHHWEDDAGEVFVLPHFTIYDKPDKYFHLVVNEDSITEIDRPIAELYYEQVERIASKFFLSINHESEVINVGHAHHRVFDMAQPRLQLLYRFRHWLRPGYVEELYGLKN